MERDLSKLIDDLTKLNQAEADFQKISAKFWKCREDILRHVHESCHTVSRKLHIRIADAETVMVGGDDFKQRLALATPSFQGKRDNASTVDDDGIQGKADQSVDRETAQEQDPLSTKGLDIHGTVKESIKQQIQGLDIQGIVKESIKQQIQGLDIQGIIKESIKQQVQGLDIQGIIKESIKQQVQGLDIHRIIKESIKQQIPLSTTTKGHVIHGDANKSIDQQISPSTTTKGLDIHGDANKSVHQHIPISTEDHCFRGGVNESIHQPIAQEHNPISTKKHGNQGETNAPSNQQTSTSNKDHGNQGEAYVSIFGDGPLYPHCVETWEAANAKAQRISRPEVTPTTNVQKFW